MMNDNKLEKQISDLLGNKFNNKSKKLFAEELISEIPYSLMDGEDKNKLLKAQKRLLKESNKIKKDIEKFLDIQIKIRCGFKSITPIVKFCVETRDNSPILQASKYLNLYQEELSKLKLSKSGPKNAHSKNVAYLIAKLYYKHLGSYPSAAKKDEGRLSTGPYDRVCDFIEACYKIIISESTRLQVIKIQRG